MIYCFHLWDLALWNQSVDKPSWMRADASSTTVLYDQVTSTSYHFTALTLYFGHSRYKGRALLFWIKYLDAISLLWDLNKSFEWLVWSHLLSRQTLFAFFMCFKCVSRYRCVLRSPKHAPRRGAHPNAPRREDSLYPTPSSVQHVNQWSQRYALNSFIRWLFGPGLDLNLY